MMSHPKLVPTSESATMAVPSPTINPKSKIIRVIDLSEKSSPELPEAVVACCEESGIFKVVNHGVPMDVVSRLERESMDFFSRPTWEKQTAAGPANPPFGYGCKTIGANGDVSHLEYLLLHTQQPCFLSQQQQHSNFSGSVRDYVESVRDLACEILDLVAEGLRAPDKAVLSKLIRDVESDSILRLNHYPPSLHVPSSDNVGFGEHTDPQILTILRSNDVGGLQICTPDGLWVAVPPDPNAFFVMVGDALQVMANGRFESIKHRVVVNMEKRRMSMMYFGAPPLDALITPLPHLLKPAKTKYKLFTWSEYKKATYASRLSDCRLNLFKRQTH
ncbi:hypothetical protein V2J09_015689 [Rumex salicifolius]